MTWFLLLFSLLLLGIALWLALRARRGQQRSGLPQGRLVYADTGRWSAVARPYFSPRYRLTGKPDYLVASENLARRQRKRALVVLVTNLRDEDHETLLPAVKSLRRRHAVTVASLREPVLDEIVDSPVRDFDEALTRAAAVDYLQSRRRQLAWLRHDGVQILDVAPRDLPVTLINHYWSRKRAGAL